MVLAFSGSTTTSAQCENSVSMLSCWPNLLFLFVSYCFLFFFLPWVGCVGCDLQIDSVLTLSLPCTADCILIIIIVVVIIIIIIIIIIIYHDFLPPPRRGSHVKLDNTHTIINIHPLAHILDICPLVFSSCALFQFIPTASCNGIPPLSRR